MIKWKCLVNGVEKIMTNQEILDTPTMEIKNERVVFTPVKIIKKCKTAYSICKYATRIC